MKNLRNLSNVSQDLRKGLSDLSEQLKEPKSGSKRPNSEREEPK